MIQMGTVCSAPDSSLWLPWLVGTRRPFLSLLLLLRTPLIDCLSTRNDLICSSRPRLLVQEDLSTRNDLTFGMLMDHIYAEEESRRPNKQGQSSNSIDWCLAKGFGSRMREMRKPGMSWKRRESDSDGKTIFCNSCGKKGHLARHCRSRKFDKEMSKGQIANSSTTPTGT